MNKFDEKAQKMKNHLRKHPQDYQTVISLFKVESQAVLHERHTKEMKMRQRIAQYRKAGGEYGK